MTISNDIYSVRPPIAAYPWWAENLVTEKAWKKTTLCVQVNCRRCNNIDGNTIKIHVLADGQATRGFRNQRRRKYFDPLVAVFISKWYVGHIGEIWTMTKCCVGHRKPPQYWIERNTCRYVLHLLCSPTEGVHYCGYPIKDLVNFCPKKLFIS